MLQSTAAAFAKQVAGRSYAVGGCVNDVNEFRMSGGKADPDVFPGQSARDENGLAIKMRNAVACRTQSFNPELCNPGQGIIHYRNGAHHAEQEQQDRCYRKP